jgi:UDP-N-acetylmuramate--alanine ligase
MLREEFGRAFYDADEVIVLPIYAAGEAPIEGVTGDNLADAIRDHGHKSVTYVSDADEALERLKAMVAPGDLVMTLGAGDVWKLGRRLADWLEATDLGDLAGGI